MTIKQLAAIFVASHLVFGLTADAQTALYTFEGQSGAEWFGYSVSDAGDVNNDGFDDVIVGSPAGGSNEHARVFSGLDGSLLHSLVGVQSTSLLGDDFGYSVSGAGDTNGDGFVDVLVGAPWADGPVANTGSARLYSGLDGTLLREWVGEEGGDRFGHSVSDAGDVNADGFADVIVGSVRWNQPVSPVADARIYSGLDGSVLQSFHLGGSSGSSVSGAGDVNGDGFDDVIMLDGSTGGAIVFSGVDGSQIYSIPFPADDVSGAGDVNADGFPDLIVGGNHDAHVVSGADGSLLNSFIDVVSSCGPVSHYVSDAGDVNGDGFADVIVGDCVGILGSAQVLSGADWSVLFMVGADSSYESFGYAVSGAGDMNGDGFADVIVGAYRDNEFFFEGGNARVFSGVPVSTIGPDLCSGDGGDQMGCTNCPCGNNAPQGTVGGCLNSAATSARLEIVGSPSVSLPAGATNDLRISLTGTVPFSFCLLRSGDRIAPGNPINPCFGLPSGAQSISFDGLRCAIMGVRRHGARASDANGTVGVTTVPWGGEGPPQAGLAEFAGLVAGHNAYFQALNRDFPNQSCGRGINTSQAIHVVFQP